MKFISAMGIYVALSVSALAGEAHICSSKTVPTPQTVPLDDHTHFECPGLGSHTVPELAKAGWQIESVFPSARTDPAQPMTIWTGWTILIQKEQPH